MPPPSSRIWNHVPFYRAFPVEYLQAYHDDQGPHCFHYSLLLRIPPPLLCVFLMDPEAGQKVQVTLWHAWWWNAPGKNRDDLWAVEQKDEIHRKHLQSCNGQLNLLQWWLASTKDSSRQRSSHQWSRTEINSICWPKKSWTTNEGGTGRTRFHSKELHPHIHSADVTCNNNHKTVTWICFKDWYHVKWKWGDHYSF